MTADLLQQAMDEVFPGETKPGFVAPPVVPVEQRDDAYARRAAAWCAKALTGRAETLAAMLPDTGRNHQLNASAYLLLRYVQAGHLDVDEVVEAMRNAALECGLGNGEIEATLGSAQRAAWRDGPTEPPIGESFEGSDSDPFAGLVVDEATGEISPPPHLTPEELAQRAHERLVRLELANLRARDEAKTLYTAEKAAREFREPPSVRTLADELLIPDEPVQYVIADLLPAGGNALLAAQYKTGKTTFINNLARSFADDELFLGRYKVNPAGGRIALFNYELDASMNRRWLREMQVQHPERIVVLNLRGYRLPLTARSVEDWVVRWLEEREVTMWVVDPYARASVGDVSNENDNSEAGLWLDTLDVIKGRAGVRDLVLPTHTGRAEMEAGQERSRGATRLDDWADVRWVLTKDDAEVRYFRATGRDVDVPEEKLSFDEDTRSLRIGGGDRSWERNRRLEDEVVAFVLANPGVNAGGIEAGVTGKGVDVRRAVQKGVAGHRLRVEDGPKNSNLYWANP